MSSSTSSTTPVERILQDVHNKFTMFPIEPEFQPVWEMYLNHQRALWLADEVDLSGDLNDWKKLTPNERNFLLGVIGFFSSSDGVVMENAFVRLFGEVQVAEIRAFYVTQLFIEKEHSIVYSRLIETYCESIDEKNRLFHAIQTMPTVRKKNEWAVRWMQSSEPFGKRLVAFAFVEGIFFSSSFAAIYWISERGILPGLCISNRFIAADEACHTDFACLLYSHYIAQRMPFAEVKTMVEEAVAIEIEFITEILPCALIGMNAEDMSDYVRYVANRLIRQLGYTETVYPSARMPFPFMERIGMESLTSFFERRVSDYQRTVHSGAHADASNSIRFDADF